jgi:hypothetical protein
VVLLLIVMRATSGSVGSDGTEWLLQYKPVWVFRILNGYNMTVSAISVLVLLVSLYLAFKYEVLKIEPVGIWLVAGFSFLYLIIPSKLLGTSFADLRIIPGAVIIVAAFCSLSLPDRRSLAVAAAARAPAAGHRRTRSPAKASLPAPGTVWLGC